MIDITMGILPENNPPRAADPKAKPGLWSLVYSYSGRMTILDIGKNDNVRVALDSAYHKLDAQGELDSNGEYIFAVKYLDEYDKQTLNNFEKKLKRILNISNEVH